MKIKTIGPQSCFRLQQRGLLSTEQAGWRCQPCVLEHGAEGALAS